MNDMRIKEYVEDIFRGVKPTDKVWEQKEELIVNITERVRDYMRGGLSFDAAFDNAKNILGDTDELTAPFEKSSPEDRSNAAHAEREASAAEESGEWHGRERRSRSLLSGWQLAAISPFVYVLLGFLFGWWAWAWVIIPFAGILGAPMPFWTRLVAMSPFIYVLLGFLFGWWAWAWVIIPVAGIMTSRDYIK